MAEAIDYTRLRRDVGADATALPDADAEALFTEAAETYSGAAAIHAAARVLFLLGLLADSAKMTTYTQNQSSEKLSDVFGNVEKLLAIWQGELTAALAEEQAAVKQAGRQSVRVPTYSTW